MTKAVLRPEKGIQIESSKKYLFDPDLVNQFVEEKAEDYIESVAKPLVDSAAESASIASAAANDPNVVAVGTDLQKGVDSELVKANTNLIPNIDKISSVADNIEDVKATSMAIDDVKVVSMDIADVMTVADNVADVNTVASNMPDVKRVIEAEQNALQSETNAAASADTAQKAATGTITEYPEGSAKYWADQAQATVQIGDATEVTKGIARIATTEEADAGLDNTTIMTPAKVSKEISDNVGRGLVLGFDGTYAAGQLTFEPSDGTPYELKNNFDYEIDLFFPAAGELPDDTQFVILNNGVEIPLRNALSGSLNADYGDMKQICSYDADFGWRWIFNARYKENYDDKAFVIPSTAVKVDKGGTQLPMLMSFWSDHLLNDISFLRADTFSWQSGEVYTAAYNELLTEYNNTESVEFNEDTITGKVTPKGYKIVDASQESAVLDLYNSTGVAWYYILDADNTRFKLPRTKYGFTGLRTGVGNYVPESLPNITGRVTPGSPAQYISMGSTSEGVFGADITTTGGGGTGAYSNQNTGLTFDASRSSSTYQDGAPVQQRATEMYLYFYVGNYDKPAITQTAGLNSELFNDKADLNLNNVNQLGTTFIAHNAMPSDSYIDLTLGTTGTDYTAPADGYFVLAKASSSGQFTQMNVINQGNLTPTVNDNIIYTSLSYCSASSGYANASVLVKKNDVVRIYYTASGSIAVFRFVYAQGAK